MAQRELTQFRRAGNRRGEACMLLCQAEAFVGTSTDAFTPAEEAMALFREQGDRRLELAAMLAQSKAQLERPGDSKRGARAALATAAVARDFSREAGDKRGEAESLHAMAVAQASRTPTTRAWSWRTRRWTSTWSCGTSAGRPSSC